jgi:hypothetical protein
MKKILFLLMALTVISCDEDDYQANTSIYHEWRWVMTTFDTRGFPITSEGLDTTYYYMFSKDGILEIRDVNRELTQQLEYSITEDESFNLIRIPDLDQTWGYRINKDTLSIFEPASIFPRTDLFKKN